MTDALPGVNKPIKSSYVHGACAEPLLGRTLSSLLEEATSCHPNHQPFKCVELNQTSTFLEIHKRVDELARGFLSLGIGRGDVVTVIGYNGLDWLCIFYACASIGAIYNGPYLYNPKEVLLFKTLHELQSKAVIFLGKHISSNWTTFHSGCGCYKLNQEGALEFEKFPFLKFLVTDKEGYSDALSVADLVKRGHTVTSDELTTAKSNVLIDDPIIICSSTGTTGAPKHAVSSHFGAVNSIWIQSLHLKAKEQILTFATQSPEDDDIWPVFQTLSILAFHEFNAKLVILPSIDYSQAENSMKAYLKAIQDNRITKCLLYPGIWMFTFLSSDLPMNYDLTSLKHGVTAGWKLSKNVAAKIFKMIPNFMINYHSSEVWPITVNCHGDPTKDDDLQRIITTVGKVAPHHQIKLVDEGNRIVPIGEVGEVHVRGPTLFLFYWNNPELTVKAKDRAGWYHTGDMAKMDENGFITFIGRKADAVRFKSWGDVVYPGYIEDAIKLHASISEAKVIGIPNDFKGDDICLCVVVKENHDVTEEELKAFISKKLTEKDVPDYVFIFEEFTRIGARKKISLKKLTEEVKERMRTTEKLTMDDYSARFAS